MLKEKIRRKIHGFFGINRVCAKFDEANKNAHSIQALQILSFLDLPEKIKQELALQFYPKPNNGVITLTCEQSRQNAKRYLSLVRPMVSA
ncbi:hypothetical protein, partial [Helicobacter sp. CLO-3]